MTSPEQKIDGGFFPRDTYSAHPPGDNTYVE